jgi:cell division protein FtsL
MNRETSILPFVSVVMIISTLFAMVFCKMEIRRLGYSLLVSSREERKLRDEFRQAQIRLAKMTRPERVKNLAQSHFTMRRAERGQIIRITEQGFALKQ